VFAAPISKADWERLITKAFYRHQETPEDMYYLILRDSTLSPPDNDDSAGVYSMSNEDLKDVCVLFRNATHTDDACKNAAAWIRTVKRYSGMIYATPATNNDVNSTAAILSTSACPPEQVVMVDYFSGEPK
jgi:hypothetical protein